ncbi:hypothetical protein LH407_04680 [Antiquaquibacter oligotrophicus]|uniref:hypothetical protein n=1 Tax=Antiquaquibacter oligotrophicus TaxID=2880260 RepID=UPI002AC985BC|nr:hypothetical protein [Antiquaquibacter oligotrophicus]UDF14159.1 hypothetical protein LH407_04680 [Antiquaquibacter oligotrophicus]
MPTLGDVIDLRPAPGPRDWVPSNRPPDIAPHPKDVPRRPRATRQRVHPARGIGLLAILLGAITVVVALGLFDGRDAGFPGIVAFTAAFGASIAALTIRGLPARTRTVAWCAITLVATAGGIVGLATFRVSNAPPPSEGVVAREPTSVEVAQIAGTLAYLLAQSPETCPEQLAPLSTGVLELPAGNIYLPAGADFSYSADGTGNCSFSIGVPGSEVAVWDSATNAVALVRVE